MNRASTRYWFAIRSFTNRGLCRSRLTALARSINILRLVVASGSRYRPRVRSFGTTLDVALPVPAQDLQMQSGRSCARYKSALIQGAYLEYMIFATHLRSKHCCGGTGVVPTFKPSCRCSPHTWATCQSPRRNTT